MPHFPDALVSGADLPARAQHRLGTGRQRPPPQQCGRCRLLFEGDPTLHPAARPDWWLCPQCRAILLGRNPHPNDVAHRRHVGPDALKNHLDDRVGLSPSAGRVVMTLDGTAVPTRAVRCR
jgi:hypothetical protein